MTDQVFALHMATRNNLLTYLENVTPEQLAQIPAGFHNSIWWNIAHCVATQQILCYRLSGVKPVVSDDFIETYKKGTYPDGHIPTSAEIEELKELLISTVNWLETDYQKGIFKHYNHYVTGIEYELNTIEEAIYFNISHEGVHLGSVLALKCAITGSKK